jgi:protein-S-isoprenylcysteine O-methyltransferase Ste14
VHGAATWRTLLKTPDTLTGISRNTALLGRPESPPMEKKRKIVPLVYLFSALILMLLLHGWAPLGRYVQPPFHYCGLVFVVFGLAMTGVSAGMFKKADTGLVPFEEATALVTGGFFRFTRNPMYLGMVFVLAGCSMLMGSWSTLLPIVLFMLVIHSHFILAEERFMEAAFGEDYQAYRKKVRRWL